MSLADVLTEQQLVEQEYDRGVREDIELFRSQAALRTAGQMTDDELRPQRLRRGVYSQRQADVRIRPRLLAIPPGCRRHCVPRGRQPDLAIWPRILRGPRGSVLPRHRFCARSAYRDARAVGYGTRRVKSPKGLSS